MKTTKMALLVATLSSLSLIWHADWTAPSVLDYLVALTAAVMWLAWIYYKVRKREDHE